MAPAPAPAPGVLGSDQPAAEQAQALATCNLEQVVPGYGHAALQLPTGSVPAFTARLVFLLPTSWCPCRDKVEIT